MELKKVNTETILKFMKILAWIAVIGFLIEAGSILFSYIYSCINPEAAKNLYKGLNLYELRQLSFRTYSFHVSFLFVVLSMKAYVWFLVTQTLSTISLANPFKIEVALLLEKISYILFGTWIVGMLNNLYNDWVEKNMDRSLEHMSTDEFIFMAGLIFIISQVFKRGVEIQSENELTV